AAMICLFLQVTLLGWLPAAIWAVHALLQDHADQEAKAALYH
ncbi:YqaE/Pmp3 family membrane protein, partial [Acinetobacter nosocomialis]